MVMDYQKMNKQMVKNNYPLPLITDLVDTMDNKRVFTKMGFVKVDSVSGLELSQLPSKSVLTKRT